jgi:hypothetical protein
MKFNNKNVGKFLSQIIVDFIVITAMIFAVYYIFYFPWALVALMTLFMISVRYEDFEGKLVEKDMTNDDIYSEPFGDYPNDPSK